MLQGTSADGMTGSLLQWGEGSLFLGDGGYLQLTDNDHFFFAKYNATFHYDVDHHGDWVPVEPQKVCVSGDGSKVTIHFPDGTIITDELVTVLAIRSRMDSNGIRKWGPRLAHNGLEVSDHTISFSHEPVATRKHGRWEWCVPSERVPEIAALAEEYFGVGLLDEA